MYNLYNKVPMSRISKTVIDYKSPLFEEKLVKEVEKQILKDIKDGKFDLNPENPESDNKKGKYKRRLSDVGMTMITNSIVSNSLKLHESAASGDSAQIAENSYSAAKGLGTLAISTFGGSTGQIIAMITNIIDGLVGQEVKNQIQLAYDNGRLLYNFTRNDIGRNSTMIYDEQQQKWIAKDTKKIMSNVLNQNNFV